MVNRVAQFGQGKRFAEDIIHVFESCSRQVKIEGEGGGHDDGQIGPPLFDSRGQVVSQDSHQGAINYQQVKLHTFQHGQCGLVVTGGSRAMTVVGECQFDGSTHDAIRIHQQNPICSIY